jgi:predicted ATP-dependent endonuclease of OLD family
MNVLYVNNFRGFHNTYLPLKDVNFLVGENSTGKTSILSLIRLLSDHRFWFTFDFNTDEVDLGYFNEISNNNLKGNGSFNIGFLRNSLENTNEAVYISFKNLDGIPFISEFNYTYNELDVRIILLKEKIKYKINKIDDELLDEDSFEFFKGWIHSIKTSHKRGYNFSNETLDDIKHRSTHFIKAIVEDEINNKLKDIEFGPTIPIFIEDLNWIAPIRAKPKRIYENYNIHYSAEGEHSPYVLKSLLKSKKNKSKELILKYIEPFGHNSGLFDKINVKNYGKEKTSPYELIVTLNDQEFKISNVGYGVSQVLPIFTDMVALNDDSCLSIQQPEVHLHPKAQAALGELIFNVHVNDNKKFIIETHSEYLIDRFRINLSKNKDLNISSQILFFERKNNGNIVHIIDIEKDGKYSENQPASFTNFFIEEEFELLEI